MTQPSRRTPHERDLLAGLVPHTLAHALLLLGAHPELVVTSGRRDPARNRAVGGVPDSFHLSGRAVDFIHPSLTYLYRASTTARIQRVGPTCTGPEEVIVHDKGSGLHLHVAW